MSCRASVLSPITSTGLGTMPGSSSSSNRYGLTTYANTYSRHSVRSPSVTRKFSSTVTPSRTSSTSRPLPSGPGPLDTSGRKLANYSASDFKRTTYSPTIRTPLKADHSFRSGYKSSAIDYSPSVGTLARKYSTSDTTKTDTFNRSRRAQSISAVDREFSHLTLNGHDSIKASPRPVDSDDSLYGRTSRKDRYNTEQKLHDDNLRTGSRISRISSTSDTRQDDNIFSPRSEHQGRGSSISRDIIPLRKKDSFTEALNKPLSRQSSNSSLSNVSSMGLYSRLIYEYNSCNLDVEILVSHFMI